MAVEKLSGKTKLVATKVVATPDGTRPDLPDRRDSFPVPRGPASVCAVRGRKKNRCPCGRDLQWVVRL